jgi:valyl-tRNA synthetase
MSKSLGNGIDPLDIAEKFGADAGRIALIAGTAPGTDSKISEDKIKGYKHFANKLWNITRFVLTYTDGVNKESVYTENDKKIAEEWNTLKKEITNEYETYKFHLVSEKLYQFSWHRFADEILEESKKILAEGTTAEQQSRKRLLREILQELITMLHPLMPFVTEAIFGTLPEKNGRLLMVSEWPKHV